MFYEFLLYFLVWLCVPCCKLMCDQWPRRHTHQAVEKKTHTELMTCGMLLCKSTELIWPIFSSVKGCNCHIHPNWFRHFDCSARVCVCFGARQQYRFRRFENSKEQKNHTHNGRRHFRTDGVAVRWRRVAGLRAVIMAVCPSVCLSVTHTSWLILTLRDPEVPDGTNSEKMELREWQWCEGILVHFTCRTV